MDSINNLQEFNQLVNEGTNQVIGKCLDAIHTILSFKDVIDEYFKSFEEDLGYLFSILDHTDKIEFSDHLLLLATDVIKNYNLNSYIYEPIQKNMAKILHRNDETIDIFFHLFYYWSINGVRFITEGNPSLIIDVIFPPY